MRRSAQALIRYLFPAVILITSTASAQNDIEDPNTFEDVWYRIALDEEGTYLLGDGDGYAGGTWYYYPPSEDSGEAGWWRHWFYNGPYDENRKGYLDYAVYIKAIDPGLQTSLEIRFNWATPAWSALGKHRPPLPVDTTAATELKEPYMDSYKLQTIENWFITGTFEPIKSHTIWDYNPEWVSIDIRGHNAYVYRGAYHYSLARDPAMGACYDSKTGDCYTGYESDCRAPYVWLGAGSSCADCIEIGPFPVPVYQFGSSADPMQYFTTFEREKDSLLAESGEDCAFQGIAYCAFTDDADPNCRPVHQFWSSSQGGYFYTIEDAEKAGLSEQSGEIWVYDGPVFYAYPEGSQPDDAVPVYRFWSESSGGYFYTISESEKDALIEAFPQVWTYEGIAWYAYAP